jgi:hypothetical protein
MQSTRFWDHRESQKATAHLGVLVAIGVQADLGDERVVRNHHRAWPEQRLEVVWKLAAARIARVHGDEDAARGVKRDLGVLKHKARHVGHDRELNSQNLLRHHRQHFQVDAVELIKARPARPRDLWSGHA